jgi:DNA-binding transcriptional LysR family regulator
LDSLSALKVFAKAAEMRSFTEAGQQLSLSASAVGKAVARLEERLSVRLFHRSTRSITLTQEGQQSLQSCRRIFAELETIESGFAESKGLPQGRLRVSLPLIGMLMMPTLSQFMAAHPSIELDLDFTDHLVDVITGGFDAVVRTGESSDSGLIARSLGTYRLQIVGSPAYLKRSGIPRLPADLIRHACLHHRFPTTGKLQRWPFVATTDDEVALPITLASSTVEPLIALAEAGHGLTCVPDFATRRQVAEGRLLTVLVGHMAYVGTIRAMWPASPYVSPKLRAFVDFMAAHLIPQAPAKGPSAPR